MFFWLLLMGIMVMLAVGLHWTYEPARRTRPYRHRHRHVIHKFRLELLILGLILVTLALLAEFGIIGVGA